MRPATSPAGSTSSRSHSSRCCSERWRASRGVSTPTNQSPHRRMKVFLAGASGAIGRPLVRQLIERGHEVVGMTRSNAQAIEAMGAQAVVADAFDADAVRARVEAARPDVVVNELTDLAKPLNPRRYAEWLAGTNRLRREGTKNLADAAVAAG